MARSFTHEFLDLYVFTPGRRAWSAARVGETARARGLTDIADRADAVVATDTALVGEYQRWDVTKVDAEGRAASTALVGADQRRDRSVGGLYRDLQNKADLDDADISTAAVTISRRAFPLGAEPIVNAPFVEETALITNVLGLLEGELSAAVATAGIGPWVAQIKKHNTTFRELYGTLAEDRAGKWKELKERDRAGVEAFANFVVQILAATERDLDLRTALLAEVERQQAELKELYRRRGGGRIPDVNPTTGDTQPEPTPTPAPPSDP